MKLLKWIPAVLVVLALVAVAQKPSDVYRGLSYDKNTEVKLNGEIAELQDFDCPVSKAMGNHAIVKTSDGNMVVHTAPVKFMKEYGLELQTGMKVQVVGSKVKDTTGRDTILAREIVADNVTYRFRDANGKPIW
jgi:hypothetical protein